MIKAIVFVLLILDPVNTFSGTQLPEVTQDNFEEEGDITPSIRAIKLYMATWDIETAGFDNLAKNDTTNAKGCLQITDICYKEANRILHEERFDSLSAFNPVKATEIWLTIQKKHNSNFDISKGAGWWIAGKSKPKSDYGKYYVRKINKLIHERYEI